MSENAFDVLGHRIRRKVMAQWDKPCEAAFDWLAEEHPKALLSLLKPGLLSDWDLSCAAESASRIKSKDAKRALVSLLLHESPIVREGAVYGLAHRSDSSALIERVAHEDASPAVREAAMYFIREDK